MKKLLRWLASGLPPRRQARLLAWVLPNHLWYRGALRITQLQGALVGLFGGNRKLTEAVMLDHWLYELTAIGPFPIPYVLHGIDVIQAADPAIGTVYSWIHEPLVEIPMQAFLAHRHSEGIVIADDGRIGEDGQYMVIGTGVRLTAVPANRYALSRANRALSEGSSVVCLADGYLGGPLMPYLMQLAGRVGARVVFHWATLLPDGTIDITFVNAPRPYCENEEAVNENLTFLKAAQQRMLRSIGIPESLPGPDQSLPEKDVIT